MPRLSLFFLTVATLFAQTPATENFHRDPTQPIDQPYTDLIKKYTTAPALNSPLADYLPASPTIPTPQQTLGDIAGAPDILPYAEDVYKYFRALAAATPRVKVFTIGHHRRRPRNIAVAIADDRLLAQSPPPTTPASPKLADPRTIQPQRRQSPIPLVNQVLLLFTTSPAPSTPRNRRTNRPHGTRLSPRC